MTLNYTSEFTKYCMLWTTILWLDCRTPEWQTRAETANYSKHESELGHLFKRIRYKAQKSMVRMSIIVIEVAKELLKFDYICVPAYRGFNEVFWPTISSGRGDLEPCSPWTPLASLVRVPPFELQCAGTPSMTLVPNHLPEIHGQLMRYSKKTHAYLQL